MGTGKNSRGILRYVAARPEERDAKNKRPSLRLSRPWVACGAVFGSTGLPALLGSLESKETERSLDFVAARPEERDARKEGRHSVRDDGGLLAARCLEAANCLPYLEG